MGEAQKINSYLDRFGNRSKRYVIQTGYRTGSKEMLFRPLIGYLDPLSNRSKRYVIQTGYRTGSKEMLSRPQVCYLDPLSNRSKIYVIQTGYSTGSKELLFRKKMLFRPVVERVQQACFADISLIADKINLEQVVL